MLFIQRMQNCFTNMREHTVKWHSQAACRAAPQTVHPYSTQRTSILRRHTQFTCRQRTGILTNFWRTRSPQFTALANRLLQPYLKIYLLSYANTFLLKDAVQMKGAIHVSFSVNFFFNFSQCIFDCLLFLKGQNSICKNAWEKMDQLMSNSISSATTFTSHYYMKRKGNDALFSTISRDTPSWKLRISYWSA